jgi:hypothetical protein
MRRQPLHPVAQPAHEQVHRLVTGGRSDLCPDQPPVDIKVGLGAYRARHSRIRLMGQPDPGVQTGRSKRSPTEVTLARA